MKNCQKGFVPKILYQIMIVMGVRTSAISIYVFIIIFNSKKAIQLKMNITVES